MGIRDKVKLIVALLVIAATFGAWMLSCIVAVDSLALGLPVLKHLAINASLIAIIYNEVVFLFG
ncbi:hypothetical protein OAF54_01720 [bacterium]|nr:hypothetical protein [bacterium]